MNTKHIIVEENIHKKIKEYADKNGLKLKFLVSSIIKKWLKNQSDIKYI